MDKFKFTVRNDTVSFGKYTGSGGAVTIPSTINGLPVTSIGVDAFCACTSLTSVMIPNSVTSIGPGAFSCCRSLGAITVDALNSVYSSVDGVLFNKSQTALIQCPGGKVGSYTIPDSVTSIGNRTFGGCASLTGVYFHGNAPSVDSSVFYNDNHAIVYYLLGTTGWGSSNFCGRPAVLWKP